MASKPVDKTLLPGLIPQNPAPFEADSQERKTAIQNQTDRIMEVFLQLLPSNYVSQVMGPHYTLQFQAAAERLADFQVTAQELFADADFDYTRSEVLFQILGALVFPDAQTSGWPTLQGDLTYRNFLRRMVTLLLQGSTAQTMKEGVELLTDAVVTVIERDVEARKLKGASAWGSDDAFTVEINVTGSRTISVGGQTTTLEDFPGDPFVLIENIRIVMKALKPAHVLYDYRHVFTETLAPILTDSFSMDISSYYYEDFRKYCLGIKEISGTSGATLNDRSLFSDPSRDFSSVRPGAVLKILTGINATGAGTTEAGWVGHYRVEEVRAFPIGGDAVAHPYTTTSGLSGTATVSGDTLEDTNQNWALAPEGDILTFSTGPNAGRYRLKTVLGLNGGPVGFATGPATRVRIAPSILHIQGRMLQAAVGQQYTVEVDRLGVQGPRTVTGEDATRYFIR